MINVKLIFERYTTIPDQKKNPDQKILFFHGEIQFSKCGIWTEFRPIRQVVILFREGLHILFFVFEGEFFIWLGIYTGIYASAPL